MTPKNNSHRKLEIEYSGVKKLIFSLLLVHP